MKVQTTCQCCGRAIKSKHGVIAHHGYQRPGQGWQTASCWGARKQPYEVTCEDLKGWRDNLVLWISANDDAIADFKAKPPETLEVRTKNTFTGRTDVATYTRPEGFNPDDYYGSMPRTYGNAYSVQAAKLKRHGKEMRDTLEFTRDRIAKWTAPTAEWLAAWKAGA